MGMGKLNVAQFATELGLPVALLLEQLRAAGIAKQHESDPVSEKDKANLLDHLQLVHGFQGVDPAVQMSMPVMQWRYRVPRSSLSTSGHG